MAILRALCRAVVLAACVAWCSFCCAEEAVFPIRAESVLDEQGNIQSDYMRYGRATLFAGICSKTPTPGVKYPTLHSQAPFYGQATFRSSLGRANSIREVCFVLDATGDDPQKLDVMYLDTNGDRELTSDEKITAAEKPPTGLSLFGGAGSATAIFNYVDLKGADENAPAERFLPWLTMQGRQQPYLVFLATTVRKGTIRLGEQSYEAVLGGRYQGRGATIMVRPEGSTSRSAWTNLMLETLQQADGQFFTLSVDAKGQQLTVAPYEGEYGELKLKAGGDAPQAAGLAAYLYRQDRTSFRIGEYYSTELPRQCRVPVGDYRASLYVDYGSVRVGMSSEGYDVKIRADEPLELQFSQKPTVTFTSPSAGLEFRPGSVVALKAMMKDTQTGMLIRALYDRSKTDHNRVIRSADGTSTTVPVFESLVPMMKIVDATGKEVASGKMPFG